MKKALWYTIGVIGVGALLYFILGWITSLLTIIALTIVVFVVFMFLRKRLNKD